MKILCLSDLHLSFDIKKGGDYDLYQFIKKCLEDKPHVVIITGDIFENNYQYKINPYKYLSDIFHGIPVICTLGNHEFVDDTVKNVLRHYKEIYDPKYDVHYLDIVDYYDIGNVRFLGNILWYDGSMSNMENQKIETFADGRWLDAKIIDLDFKKECKKCVNAIKKSISDDMINVLCTHCVPHYKLNMHMRNKSDFNAYSGVYDLLDKIKVDYSISGHTHFKTIGQTINDCKCINVGNDYYPPYYSYLLEI